MTSRPEQFWSAISSGIVRLLIATAAMLAPTTLSLDVAAAIGQSKPGREIVFPKVIKWNKLSGVISYRLQIAGDEHFQDVFFDGPVEGEEYIVSDLSAGYYYWRVAPVVSRPVFSPPLRFFVSGGVVTMFWVPNRATARSSGIVGSKVP